MLKIAIIMGSKSDFEVVKPALKVLKSFEIETDVHIISAHRTPDIAHEFALNAIKNNYGVIIAAAGKSAHLAGVLAASTIIPVIGLPIQTSFMGGLDSLLSIVQMPSGIPVATVGVNAAENAGILAAQILALTSGELAKKIKDFKKQMAEKIANDDKTLQSEINL
ncbi:MAG: 5-(carboxyamino)imidazole ribonucleotide mutase [Clostridia bacterium]